VHVLAVSEKRGLVLADARMIRDTSLAGQGWFNVKGEDSPGAVGSPVLNSAGEIVGIVGMQVPLKHWMNFALAPDYAAYEIQRRRPPLKPLSQLPDHPRIGDVAADSHFMDAFTTLGGKRTESAVSKLLKLTAKYPRSAECWALLGLGAARLGAIPEAVSCQRKAVALDPKTGLYWHQLAMAKLRVENPSDRDAAEDREALEHATEQRPGDKLVWLLLASRYLKDNDLEKADSALRQVTKQEPDYAHGFYLLAYVRGRLRDYTGAEAAISRCLDLDSTHADAWYYRGLLLSRAADHAKAADAFRSATRQRPDHPQAWLNLAHEYQKIRRGTEARLAFLEHQRVTARITAAESAVKKRDIPSPSR
jgi:predicted Zn-dependent protease